MCFYECYSNFEQMKSNWSNNVITIIPQILKYNEFFYFYNIFGLLPKFIYGTTNIPENNDMIM